MGFIEQLEDFTNLKVNYNEPMKKHTGYGVGGNAKYFIEADNLHSISVCLELCENYKIPFKIIGNGTNLLVLDGGYNGLIISTKQLSNIYTNKDKIKVMCGASINRLANFCLVHSLSGMEMLYGIPATIGGAVFMNAGAFMHNISENIVEVDSISNGKIKKYNVDDCKFGYRKSIFQSNNEIIVSATFCFENSDKKTISEKMKSVSEVRKFIHPKERSCGCVFKNPKEASAGQLIDALNLKGFNIGGARISERHGNFIVANNSAKANDIVMLINYVKSKVKSAFDIDLKEEIELLGEF